MRKLIGWMLQFSVHMKARDLRRNRDKWPNASRKDIKETMMRHCARQFYKSWGENDPK